MTFSKPITFEAEAAKGTRPHIDTTLFCNDYYCELGPHGDPNFLHPRRRKTLLAMRDPHEYWDERDNGGFDDIEYDRVVRSPSATRISPQEVV